MIRPVDGSLAELLHSPSVAPVADGSGGLRWSLRKNCSMSPARLLGALALTLAPASCICTMFALMGAPMVLVFNGLEVLVMLCAFVWYARGAADQESLAISAAHVEVGVRMRGVTSHWRFQRSFVSVRLLEDQDDLICMAESGRSVVIGRHVPRHMRRNLFQEVGAHLAGRATPVSVAA